MTLSWIYITTPDGTVIDLDDRTNITVETEGCRGLGMTPFEYGTESLSENLSRFQQVKTSKRVIELPLLIQAASIAALEAALGTINDLLNPINGDSVLTITRADGSKRTITCRYLDGFEGDFGNGQYGLVWQKYTLNLQAIDPLFYAVTPITQIFSGTTPTLFFKNPFFPLNLSGSTVIGTATITNPGSVDAWPIWTITGPGNNLVLKNITTGKALELPIVLLDGQVITIDTHPGLKTVLSNSGENYYPMLKKSSALWPFIKGANSIQAEFNEIILGVSSVSFTFNPPYMSM